MRPCTQVPPAIADVVESDGFRLDRLQDLELEWLTEGFDARPGFFPVIMAEIGPRAVGEALKTEDWK